MQKTSVTVLFEFIDVKLATNHVAMFESLFHKEIVLCPRPSVCWGEAANIGICCMVCWNAINNKELYWVLETIFSKIFRLTFSILKRRRTSIIFSDFPSNFHFFNAYINSKNAYWDIYHNEQDFIKRRGVALSSIREYAIFSTTNCSTGEPSMRDYVTRKILFCNHIMDAIAKQDALFPIYFLQLSSTLNVVEFLSDDKTILQEVKNLRRALLYLSNKSMQS